MNPHAKPFFYGPFYPVPVDIAFAQVAVKGYRTNRELPALSGNALSVELL